MNKPFAPESFRKLFMTLLQNPDIPAFGQVATLDEAGKAPIRTVHFRYVFEYETVGFVTNQGCQKWKHLLKNPEISGCYFSQEKMLQFRWLSKAELITPQTQTAEAQATIERMWEMVRPTIRRVYWYDHLKISYDKPEPSDLDIHKVCPAFGIILCRPYFWDLYEMPDEDYRKHLRSEHRLENGKWNSTKVALLTARPIATA